MATLEDYFTTDFSKYASCDQKLTNNATGATVSAKVAYEFDSKTRILICYLNQEVNYFEFAQAIIQDSNLGLGSSANLICLPGRKGDTIKGNLINPFSRTIYFYCQREFSESQINFLDELAKQHQVMVVFRSTEYMKHKASNEKPLAFISHDSRDKDTIASKIAIGLSKQLIPVWYDEYSLKIGDSLRASIEKGLKEAKKCILVLTPNFLQNSSWAKKEYDSIFTRELIENSNVILPIWNEVTKKQIYDYSPALADKVALDWSKGEDFVVSKLAQEIRDKE